MLSKCSFVRALSGYTPAIPTPFKPNGEVDIVALERYCDWQIKEGARALVVCGTTGEAPTLTEAEHDTIVRAAVAASRTRVPVIAGAGSNSTVHAQALARDAERAGADAILSVVPYYNRPTARGLYEHFIATLDAASLPVILYDVPARTGCALPEETIVRLAQHPQCIGLKDAAGDPTRALRLRAKLGPQFRLLCGDDALALAYLAHGGDGCISVTSNVAPRLCRAMDDAWNEGKVRECQRLMAMILDLTRVLFREASPAPVKCALELRRLMSGWVRLPLCEVTKPTKYEISSVLAEVLGPNFAVGDEVALDESKQRPRLAEALTQN
jgi:4-hydroxy-tetrahydrodipicolinate synthase